MLMPGMFVLALPIGNAKSGTPRPNVSVTRHRPAALA